VGSVLNHSRATISIESVAINNPLKILTRVSRQAIKTACLVNGIVEQLFSRVEDVIVPYSL
jgi:hypothetical protein